MNIKGFFFQNMQMNLKKKISKELQNQLDEIDQFAGKGKVDVTI